MNFYTTKVRVFNLEGVLEIGPKVSLMLSKSYH